VGSGSHLRLSRSRVSGTSGTRTAEPRNLRNPGTHSVFDRCLVSPSPELRLQIRNRLRVASAELPLGRVTLQTQNRPGFNDGLIIPGREFPLGTPLEAVRRAAARRAPLRGEVRVIVILVDFTDAPMTRTADQFRDLFFSTGRLPNGSVREYFSEVSDGLVTLTGQVVGPYRLPRTLATYAGGQSGVENSEPNARTMARDAAVLANPDVDFGPFDNDRNGFVDAFIVVHAGPGAEETANGGHIWSHKWVLAGQPFNADGTQIYAYLTVPEDCRIGVCAHEIGHLVFGWPDLYDTDESSEGLGNWCLMGGGSWNGRGDVPAHPSAWCKLGQGWVAITNRASNGSITLNDVKTDHTIHRFWKDGAAGDEYFLVEYRRKTGYDRELPGEGVLIYHVDDTVESNDNERHPLVKLMEADNLNHLHNGSNRGDDGDPYPGRSANRVFDGRSTPGSKSYAGIETCVSLTNITLTGSTATADVTVSCAPARKTRKARKARKGRKTSKKRGTMRKSSRANRRKLGPRGRTR
jgi:immune inhibitor A